MSDTKINPEGDAGPDENARRIMKRDPNPHLFRPLEIRGETIKNRIMMSPMCQYCATDGLADDWHYVHLTSRAVGGAGIVSTEVVHTEPEGRITPGCLGIWSDEHRDRLARIAEAVARNGAVPAMQIGHAGRKASISRPWEGSKPLSASDGGWPVVGPSAIPYRDTFPTPAAIPAGDFGRYLDGFAAAARRAREAGFRILEIHGAHGYLIFEFLSPLSNQREDGYGGGREGRSRFLRELIAAMRSEWPDDRPLFLRVSATEYAPDGWDVEDTVWLANRLAEDGQVDLIDCSSGGNYPGQQVSAYPGYQVPFARAVKQGSPLMAGAVGLIHTPEHAESIIAGGDADLVLLGRTLLAEPYWPLKAANVLKAENMAWPLQYERANIF